MTEAGEDEEDEVAKDKEEPKEEPMPNRLLSKTDRTTRHTHHYAHYAHHGTAYQRTHVSTAPPATAAAR
ncbi:hypothetical protein ACIHAA_13970 [Streptomyces sp. NPDC052040]|uniref:hypothetical protein n=1 Tax=Streptomyces sp. NPDC052040 TaxID=3365682 RepID=UPI0037D2A28D